MSAAHRQRLIAAVVFAAVVATCLVPAIPQDLAYHHFADDRTVLGVPNFSNVISNAGYLLVGIFGLMTARRLRSSLLRPGYMAFCMAATLVAFGSSWYHIEPDNQSLVWDRLPMGAGFMALLSLVIGERISWRLAQRLLWPLVIVGVASVLYWAWTEHQGAGDLRLYALVQFLPMVLMPLLLLLFRVEGGSAGWLWLAFAAYVLAKLAELFDGAIHESTGFSGHSIKHLVSSVAVLFAVFAMQQMRVPSAMPAARSP